MSPNNEADYYSLNTRFFTLVMAVFVIASVFYISRTTADHNTQLARSYQEKLQTLLQITQQNSGRYIHSNELEQLNSYLQPINEIPGIAFSAIFGLNNNLLATSINNGHDTLAPASSAQAIDHLKNTPEISTEKHPLLYQSKPVAYLLVGTHKEKAPRVTLAHTFGHMTESLVIGLLFIISLLIFFHRQVIRPLNILKLQVEKIQQGQLGITFEYNSNNEFDRLGSAINELSRALKKTETEKEHALIRLQDGNEELKRATIAKSQFLANMSHEIRTPLTAVIGYADLLKSEKLDERHQKEYLTALYNNSKHLQGIINDILDFSKIESGKLEIVNTECSLISLLSEIKTSYQPLAIEKGLELKVNIDYPIPSKIMTDSVRLKQILFNLINNAFKFTEAGFIRINAYYQGGKHGNLVFDVQDSGIGMDITQIKRIFDTFSQADATTSRKYGGTGLGLTISRMLAMLLGGNISVISLPNKGSQFTCSIYPGRIDEQTLIHSEKEVHETTKQNNVEKNTKPQLKLNALIIDDARDVQILLSAYLKKIGCRVTIANDGIEGLEKVKQEEFDFIIVDKQMPRMDGIETTQKIRAMGYIKPIIAMSADALAEDMALFEAVGGDAYLTKPINAKKLTETIITFTESFSDE